MIDELKFEQFYESILVSLEERKIPELENDFVSLDDSQNLQPDKESTDVKIMVTSWVDFLNALFLDNSADLLLANLSNHLNFIKQLAPRQQEKHLAFFRTISVRPDTSCTVMVTKASSAIPYSMRVLSLYGLGKFCPR